MKYAVGSLVRARDREWVVLPESEEDLLVLRPLGGTEDEVTGIYVAIEKVESAQFDLPSPDKVGDYRSCRLLRDAVRLGFRSSAGPFRSFARIAVEPRPYQLVPLLMALKLDPVRMLIADDVGVGKTIEACLIAKELLDRGEASRLCVLCPPHLAEQWQAELRDKFHINAELVLASTVNRLERNCSLGRSLFEVYPYVVVSIDFIKSDRRQQEFLRACPDLVIVDEAHSCAFGGVGRGGRHQRHQLLTGLAAKPDRNLIMVTATPHSGNEEAFRSLLKLLRPEFSNLPDDLTGRENEQHRRGLAQYFVQRRRGDIRRFLADTPFPERDPDVGEASYRLSPEYRKLFQRVLQYARETVIDPQGERHRQRVRWWSALALLRSLASSPAAAAATLRSRAAVADTETPEDADEIGRRTILDLEEDEGAERLDVAPGSDIGDLADDEARHRRHLLEMARQAQELYGDKDLKLTHVVPIIKRLIQDGFQPIVFCRFIPTAEYLAEQLRQRLPKGVEVVAITGTVPPAEREERVLQLSKAPKHVLVCTDCLSEGINLQKDFDAVLHYDLSWNPTRHEQREGRVDRFGQPKPMVRIITYYGVDNQIDGIVLDVLLRKHNKIRSSLGISVPVPVNTEQIIEAVFEGVLLRERGGTFEQQQMLFDDYFEPEKEKIHKQWDAAADREKRSRTVFAQETIKTDEVARELQAVQAAIGSSTDVAEFTKTAFKAHGAIVSERNGTVELGLGELPRALKDRIDAPASLKARFELPVGEGVTYLSRTHAIVESLASFVMDTALDPQSDGVARRCGAIRTNQVQRRTTLLLVRFRYHINTIRGDGPPQPLLAEDCKLVGFTGSPENAEWIDDEAAEALLGASPDANISPDQAREFVSRVVAGFDHIKGHLNDVASSHGQELLDAHTRVRKATDTKARNLRHEVEPKLPPDVLGIYVYLPAQG
jgi:superfamily II DNA or RNA helicase